MGSSASAEREAAEKERQRREELEREEAIEAFQQELSEVNEHFCQKDEQWKARAEMLESTHDTAMFMDLLVRTERELNKEQLASLQEMVSTANHLSQCRKWLKTNADELKEKYGEEWYASADTCFGGVLQDLRRTESLVNELKLCSDERLHKVLALQRAKSGKIEISPEKKLALCKEVFCSKEVWEEMGNRVKDLRQIWTTRSAETDRILREFEESAAKLIAREKKEAQREKWRKGLLMVGAFALVGGIVCACVFTAGGALGVAGVIKAGLSAAGSKLMGLGLTSKMMAGLKVASHIATKHVSAMATKAISSNTSAAMTAVGVGVAAAAVMSLATVSDKARSVMSSMKRAAEKMVCGLARLAKMVSDAATYCVKASKDEEVFLSGCDDKLNDMEKTLRKIAKQLHKLKQDLLDTELQL